MNIYHELLDGLIKSHLESIKESVPEENIEELLSEVVTSSINELSESILLRLKENAPKMLDEQKKIMEGFVKRNIKRWSTAVDLLELLIEVCKEAGEDFNSRYRKIAVKNNDMVFDTSVRLHARACSIAYEILWLLKGGFADGAQARWRALHEVSIIAHFICENDNELAIRYLDHVAIENYKAMNQYNEYVPRLNVSALEESECEMIRDDRQMAIEKYGREFKGAYGWASEVLNNPNPNFFDIEKATKLDHMRPYYKWASHNVHANSKGLFNKLGMVEAKEDGMLAGASNSGLTDPADQTALTMSQITTTLLCHDPNFDELIMMKIIEKITSEVGPTFFDIENFSDNSEE